MNGEKRNFQPGGEPELVKYVREVTFDSLSADRQIAGYSSVRAACGELADDFQLPARQAEAVARRLALGWKWDLVQRLGQAGAYTHPRGSIRVQGPAPVHRFWHHPVALQLLCQIVVRAHRARVWKGFRLLVSSKKAPNARCSAGFTEPGVGPAVGL